MFKYFKCDPNGKSMFRKYKVCACASLKNYEDSIADIKNKICTI